MSKTNQDYVIDSYRDTFFKYGDSPEALQWSNNGQRLRFNKLIKMVENAGGGNLGGKSILEVGCGLGHLYPLLLSSHPKIDFTGIDIVPELIEYAKSAYPQAKFLCRDIFQQPFEGEFDFGFISGVFDAPYREDNKSFIVEMLKAAFAACRIGLAFNFTSSYVNFLSPDSNYFDPSWVLSEVLENLSKKVIVEHHYYNCDVAVYVWR